MGQSVTRIDLPISGSGGVSKAYVDNAIADINDITTTLVAGNNVSITDSGTGGNHNYDVKLDDEIEFFSEDGKTKSLLCKKGLISINGDNPDVKLTCTTFVNPGDTYDSSMFLHNLISLSSVNSQENKNNSIGIMSDQISFRVNGVNTTKLTNEFLTGLDNKTWSDTSFTSGRAATEDQLKVLADRIAALEARI